MRQALNRKYLMTGMAALSLAACSQEGTDSHIQNSSYEATGSSAEMAMDTAESEAISDTIIAPSRQNGAESTPIATNLPKLAYAYGFAYSLPASDMSGLMRRHANICEQQGQMSCQILGMNLSGEIEDGNRRGTLQLAVATRHARAVRALLEDEANDADAEQLSANISTDELSKQLVDTQARIETRTALRDRLMQVLKTRKGTVQELVQAERSVAQVNEEIDQAKSWLNEMQGRVAFSRIDIRYQSAEATGSDFLDPVKGALGSLGSVLGMLVAALILILAVGLPIGGIVYAIKRLLHRINSGKTVASEG